jgi:hypothetical protein
MTAIDGLPQNSSSSGRQSALFEVQGQRIGELEVAPRTGANRAEREELLAFIAPTLAMALQNALSYQALADYRSNLERLFDQRTGELRQARTPPPGWCRVREAQGPRAVLRQHLHEIRTPLSLILLAPPTSRPAGGARYPARAAWAR